MKINSLYDGIYVMGEGIDASGKTTQLELAEKYFRKEGHKTLRTRQPGGTSIGQKIREILLNPENVQLVPEAEVLLYMADRTQHMQEVVLPALYNSQMVLQDRGQFATKTYQGHGRGLDIAFIDYLHDNVAIKENSPDSVLFFDISVDESRKRLGQRNLGLDIKNDRFESESRNYFERVRGGMYECKKQNPDLITIINAERSIEEIHKDVVKHIKELIEEKTKTLI